MEDESADEEVGEEKEEEEDEQRSQRPLRCLSACRRGSSWAFLGGPLGRLGCLFAVTGGSWGILGVSGGPLGDSWGPLGGFFGASWWHLGGLSGPLGRLFGPSWGTRRSPFAPSWNHLGALLAPSWAHRCRAFETDASNAPPRGGSWSFLGSPGHVLGPPGPFGPSWSRLGALRAPSWPPCGRASDAAVPDALSRRGWGVVGPPGLVLRPQGPFWSPHRACWALPGPPI